MIIRFLLVFVCMVLSMPSFAGYFIKDEPMPIYDDSNYKDQTPESTERKGYYIEDTEPISTYDTDYETQKPKLPETPTGVSFKSPINVSLPAGWRISKEDSNNLYAYGSNGMYLSVNLTDIGLYSTPESLQQANVRSAQDEKNGGKLYSWQELYISGAKGVQRVEARKTNATDTRSITWVGYRNNKRITITVNAKANDFDSNYQTLSDLFNRITFTF